MRARVTSIGFALLLVALAGRGWGCALADLTEGPEDGAGADGGGSDGPNGDPRDGGEGGGAADTAPPYVNPGVLCSGSYCDPASAVCCWYACISPSGDCVDRANLEAGCPKDDACRYEVTCDDEQDCERAGASGTICCGILAQTRIPGQCLRLLDCQREPDHVVYCDPEAPSPCRNGGACILDRDAAPQFICQGL